MNIFTGLLFQQGYIQDPELAVSLAREDDQEGQVAKARQEAPAPGERAKPRAWFRSGAVSSILCSTALSPFR